MIFDFIIDLKISSDACNGKGLLHAFQGSYRWLHIIPNISQYAYLVRGRVDGSLHVVPEALERLLDVVVDILQGGLLPNQAAHLKPNLNKNGTFKKNIF